MRTCAALALAFLIPCLAPPHSQQAAPTSPGLSSKVWIGRHAEFEQFLKTAPIVKTERIETGVTRPQRAYFAPGGLAGSAVLKDVDDGLAMRFLDTYRSEIAAYELDRLLELDMVPPTVERVVKGKRRSLQLWVENARLLADTAGEAIPGLDAWNRQVYRERVFDNLIVNIDRNDGNMLVDREWRLILIDHSRSFDGRRTDLPLKMTKIDRAFFENLKALDTKRLEEHVHQWTSFPVDVILKQRDRIVQHFEALIAQQGEANVILP